MKLAWLALIMAVSTVALAQEIQDPDLTPITRTSTIYSDPFVGHKNYIGSGFRGFNQSTGPSISYARRFGTHWLLGTTGFFGFYDNSHSGGDLDTAQYYKDEFSEKTTMADLNSTFFFRENGFERWGFLVRGGVGHAWTEGKAEWQRYDRDPSFFHVGDDKRLRESANVTKGWNSTYARLGAYYQFTFGFNGRLGHVLELGVGGLYFDRQATFSYTKPNGQDFSQTTPQGTLLAEINYSIAF